MNENMTTKKLYYEDSHLEVFEATVIACNNVNEHYEIILNQTAFFPEGGGQPADFGIFEISEENQISVFDVHEKNDIIRHYTKEAILPGTKVIGKIDWTHRFPLMQHHSGEHIVSGLVHAHYKFNNVGFHMGSDAVTMDFDGFLTEDDLQFLEKLANEAIYKNIPIVASFPTEEELNSLNYRSKKEIDSELRIVTIPDYDICACCAPHVHYTGEIGLIKLISSIRYKGGSRVSMLCGSKALADYSDKMSQINNISTLLSLKQKDVSDGVTRLQKEYHELKGRIIGLNNELLQYKANEIAEGTADLCLFDDTLDASLLRTYCNLLIERCTGIVAIFTPEPSDNFKYILGSKSTDVRDIGKELNKNFSGRGGGSKEMIQGSLSGDEKSIKEFLSSFTQ